MRAKRAKQYRKLMQQYSQTFGFREPYQILVDAEIVCDAFRNKIGLAGALERTLLGKVKPMITQCSMRHLYARAREPDMHQVIAIARTFERRRCGHHPDEYPEPLSEEECLKSVIDGKNHGTNKHCYAVATQVADIRKAMREIRGVPIVHIKRAVMVMQPMAEESIEVRRREEKIKFRAGLRGGGVKRKREEEATEKEGDVDENNIEDEARDKASAEADKPKKKKTKWGQKGPNPLSVKKKEKKLPLQDQQPKKAVVAKEPDGTDAVVKKKRKRVHRKQEGGDAESSTAQVVAEGGD